VKFVRTDLPGVIVVEPDVHRDERGYFLESHHLERYREGGIDTVFVQDNHSRSTRGVLRGLHLQTNRPQAKLVRVLEGSIWDVAVDVRRGSPHFGRHFGVELDAQAHRQIYIPAGFAHGFVVTSDVAAIEYKCSDSYDPSGELCIVWNDPVLGIPWPMTDPILSSKDAGAPTLEEVTERLPSFEAP
jgi:dTDP-4-dehydrorhamnose 3,5-epimerase